MELLKAMLEKNPTARISAKDALWHHFLFEEKDCNIDLIDEGIQLENIGINVLGSNCCIKMNFNED